jgi:hypothetical protein
LLALARGGSLVPIVIVTKRRAQPCAAHEALEAAEQPPHSGRRWRWLCCCCGTALSRELAHHALHAHAEGVEGGPHDAGGSRLLLPARWAESSAAVSACLFFGGGAALCLPHLATSSFSGSVSAASHCLLAFACACSSALNCGSGAPLPCAGASRTSAARAGRDRGARQVQVYGQNLRGRRDYEFG